MYYDALATGVEQLLRFFGGQNSAGRSFLDARTTPITVRNLNDNNLTYVISMMVSTAAFPDSAAIPQPSLPVQLESVGLRSIAALQFNTTAPPVEADFDAACGRLLSGSLPKGYAFDTASNWSPTYVLYSGQAATFSRGGGEFIQIRGLLTIYWRRSFALSLSSLSRAPRALTAAGPPSPRCSEAAACP